ncbi:aromatic ring-hydroxylating oxygenase subunit alpha [Paenibacillus aceris]|uniref:Vanillate O-demethylase monooxygenase subunit n=1 Tax=Paenibacillus aceris TaxID=869555 RepID=A0ABS4I644_9BACL|nr:aromatic ring-hydroxylating dioxygenase subunit alpha [Paenibacillus aceris]MBP1966387.1 vanillate O-demethylase monooxygenase subunit [Paenibacillus aceris]NHW39630.1 aromatic ring-hydroxylating dioxygenase subunit alpha [Paenibacillus aceris]
MTIQDSTLLDEWHPVLLSSALTDRPVAVVVLGEKVAVFRTSDGVHAFKDLCIHRGVPLSLGKVKGDELVCAYHGWSYNGCGTCTRIPSLPANRAIPSKAKAFVYHCVEAHGFVWVCLGEPVGSLPKVSSYIPAGFKEVWMGPYTLQAAGPRIIENFLDVSHLMFVHEGMLGDSEYAEIGDYQVHEEDGVLTSEEIVVYQPDPDGTGRGVHSRYVYEVYGPLSVAFTKRDRDTDQIFRLFLMVLPETEQRSQAFMLKQRNYAYEEADDIFIRFQDLLIEQDREMVENQKPELLPLDLQAELHLNTDRLSIAYRKRLRELGVTFGTA